MASFLGMQNAQTMIQGQMLLLPTAEQYNSALSMKAQNLLISPTAQLAQDLVIREYVRNKWLAACPLDERIQDRVSKIAWLQGIGALFIRDLEACSHRAHSQLFFGPDPAKLAAAEFMSRAPQTITLELYCNTANVLEQATDVDDTVFQQALPIYGRMDYCRDPTWSAYAKWLSEQEDKSVLFGSMECDKTDDIGEKIVGLLGKLGLETCYSGAILLKNHELSTASTFWFGINPKVGENLYYPSTRAAFAVQISIEFRKPTEVDKANLVWKKSLLASKMQSIEADNPKTFIIVKKTPATSASEGEDSQGGEKLYEYMLATCHALWLHAKFDEEYHRLVSHFEGEGESVEISSRLKKKGTTDSANLTLVIFAHEFANIKGNRASGWPGKLAATVALTMAATNDVSWMRDNGRPEEVEQQIRLLSKYLRTTLLKKTDAELGLGLPNETVDDSDMSDSRKALYRLLEVRAMRLDGPPGHLKLKWKPGVSKKRKISPTAVASSGVFFASEKPE